jgi:hypothetical protein
VADTASVKSPCQGGAVATVTRGRNDDGRMKIKFPRRKTGVRGTPAAYSPSERWHTTVSSTQRLLAGLTPAAPTALGARVAQKKDEAPTSFWWKPRFSWESGWT